MLRSMKKLSAIVMHSTLPNEGRFQYKSDKLEMMVSRKSGDSLSNSELGTSEMSVVAPEMGFLDVGQSVDVEASQLLI